MYEEDSQCARLATSSDKAILPLSMMQECVAPASQSRVECVALSLDDKEDSESPQTQSRFLCASNFAALLETASFMSLGATDSLKQKGKEADPGADSGGDNSTLGFYSTPDGKEALVSKGSVRYVERDFLTENLVSKRCSS